MQHVSQTNAMHSLSAMRAPCPPDQLLTLIYTSGTTGNPKGVMLTQDNLYSNVIATKATLDVSTTDKALSFLPLSHIFERTGDYFLFAHGVSIAYAESIDTVPVNMSEVKPTLMMSVPRLYEKIYARIVENAVAGGGLKKSIFFWAKNVGERLADERLAGQNPRRVARPARETGGYPGLLKTPRAHRRQFAPFLCLGAHRCRQTLPSSFTAPGLVILEGYGLTETSPVIACNTLVHYRLGSVGRPIAPVWR